MSTSDPVAQRTAMMQAELQEKLRLCFEAQSRTQQYVGPGRSARIRSWSASSDDLCTSIPGYSIGGHEDLQHSGYLVAGTENIPPPTTGAHHAYSFDNTVRREPLILSEVNLNRMEIDVEKSKTRVKNPLPLVASHPLTSSLSSINTLRDGQFGDALSRSGSRFSLAHQQIPTSTHDVSRSTDLNKSYESLAEHELIERPLGMQVHASSIWPTYTPGMIPPIQLRRPMPQLDPAKATKSSSTCGEGDQTPSQHPPLGVAAVKRLGDTEPPLAEAQPRRLIGANQGRASLGKSHSGSTKWASQGDRSSLATASSTDELTRSTRRGGIRKPAVPRQVTPQRARLQHYNDSKSAQGSLTARSETPMSSRLDPIRRSASADQDRRSSVTSCTSRRRSQRPSQGGVSNASQTPNSRPLDSARSIVSRRSTSSLCNSSFRDDPSRPAFITKSDRKSEVEKPIMRQPLRQASWGVAPHEVQSTWMESLCTDKKEEDQRGENLTKLNRSQSASLQRSELRSLLCGADDAQQTMLSSGTCRRWLWERPPLSARSSAADVSRG